MTDQPSSTLSPGERQILIRDIVVEHDRYQQAFQGLSEFHRPVRDGVHAIGCLSMLIGDSRTGKTFVSKRYARGFPTTVGDGAMIKPVVYVDLPQEFVGGARGVLANIADALDFPHTQR